jgi:ribosomal protein S6
MPLYELSIIAKGAFQKTLHTSSAIVEGDKMQWKQILTFCAKFILDNKGVVREFKYYGVKDLPYRMRAFQEIHSSGW